jgi:hypothetical protein
MRILLLVIIAALAVFGAVVALQPAEFSVARTLTMAAPPQAVFAQVDDLRKWDAWNPWQKKDPAMKIVFTGPSSGTGASYSWSGNREVGEGRLTITQSRPNEFVQIKLEFAKPFQATNTASFRFLPVGNQTAVTWSMQGHNNYFAKAVNLVMNMDKRIGREFENGLADMKAAVESAPKQ